MDVIPNISSILLVVPVYSDLDLTRIFLDLQITLTTYFHFNSKTPP